MNDRQIELEELDEITVTHRHQESGEKENEKKKVKENLKKINEEFKKTFSSHTQVCKLLKMIFAIGAFVISVSIGIAALVKSATPFYLFSYIPYFFVVMIFRVFGMPYPFAIGDESNLSFDYMVTYEIEVGLWLAQFFLAMLFPAPFFITGIIWGLDNQSWISFLIVLSHIFIYLFGYNAFNVFCSKNILKNEEEDEEEF